MQPIQNNLNQTIKEKNDSAPRELKRDGSQEIFDFVFGKTKTDGNRPPLKRDGSQEMFDWVSGKNSWDPKTKTYIYPQDK